MSLLLFTALVLVVLLGFPWIASALIVALFVWLGRRKRFHGNQEIKALKRQLEERDRLLREVAHDLKAPLARMALALGEEQESEIVEREIRNLERLIEELTALSRCEPQLLDLAAVARTVFEEQSALAKRKHQTLELSLEPAPVMADERLLHRLISNLLGNALRYTQSGGTVRLETGRNAGNCFVIVRDNGPGIPADAMPHLFEPYIRGPEGGTGLGLSIVRGIAERFGGTASIRSDEEGTVAEARFPGAF